MSRPPVMLIDIDNTIIGNITPQIIEYSYISSLEKSKEFYRRRKDFIERLKDHLSTTGLMRPGFADFCLTCKDNGIPILLYTASEDKWAKFLMPRIQAAVNVILERRTGSTRTIKFAGMFTRYNSLVQTPGKLNQQKSLDKISKRLLLKLKKKNLVGQQESIAKILKRTILIDNIPRNLKEDDHQVLVKSYDFEHWYTMFTKDDVLYNLGGVLNVLDSDDETKKIVRTLLAKTGQSPPNWSIKEFMSWKEREDRRELFNKYFRLFTEKRNSTSLDSHSEDTRVWRSLSIGLGRCMSESATIDFRSMVSYMSRHLSRESQETRETQGTRTRETQESRTQQSRTRQTRTRRTRESQQSQRTRTRESRQTQPSRSIARTSSLNPMSRSIQKTPKNSKKA